jgi:hypothetical protein
MVEVRTEYLLLEDREQHLSGVFRQRSLGKKIIHNPSRRFPSPTAELPQPGTLYQSSRLSYTLLSLLHVEEHVAVDLQQKKTVKDERGVPTQAIRAVKELSHLEEGRRLRPTSVAMTDVTMEAHEVHHRSDRHLPEKEVSQERLLLLHLFRLYCER